MLGIRAVLRMVKEEGLSILTKWIAIMVILVFLPAILNQKTIACTTMTPVYFVQVSIFVQFKYSWFIQHIQDLNTST